jgi:hypothetical protein
MKQFAQNYTVQLKGTGQVESRNLGAYSFIYIYSSSQPFQISFDGVTFIVGYAGLTFSVLGSSFFLRAASSLDATVSFIASNFQIGFAPQILPVKEAQTKLKGWSGNTLSGGQAVAFYGTGGDGASQAGAAYLWRKAIIVCNNNSSSVLEIWDITQANRIATVQPDKAFYLETSDDVVVKNETLSDIDCRISEIFYPANE